MSETATTDPAPAPAPDTGTLGGGASAPDEARQWMVTAGLCLTALLLGILVFATNPSAPTAEVLAEEGTRLFPELNDPHAVAAIEIIEYDEATAAATPFKVLRKNGRWVLPSHEDYPAEAQDRVIKITSLVGQLTRGFLQSARDDDHAENGVIDPLDSKVASLQGRGLRCTLKDETERVLADFVVGKDVKDRPDFKLVRLVGQSQTYGVNLKDVDLSADFYDWIEKDLLKMDNWLVRRVEIDNYRVDERTMQLIEGDELHITKPKSNNRWVLEELKAGEAINDERIDAMMTALDELEIVSVRRKPEGVTRTLAARKGFQPPATVLRDLAMKGFFFTQDAQVVSNEGELRVWDESGVKYTLRFGELAEAVKGDAERRYLMVSAEFDPAMLPEPQKPAPKDGGKKDEGKKDEGKKDEGKKDEGKKDEGKKDEGDKDGSALQDGHEHGGHAGEGDGDDDEDHPADEAEWKKKHDEWAKKVADGQKKAKELSDRFADWYYVIPGEVYKKVKVQRADLVKPKGKDD